MTPQNICSKLRLSNTSTHEMHGRLNEMCHMTMSQCCVPIVSPHCFPPPLPPCYRQSTVTPTIHHNTLNITQFIVKCCKSQHTSRIKRDSSLINHPSPAEITQMQHIITRHHITSHSSWFNKCKTTCRLHATIVFAWQAQLQSKVKGLGYEILNWAKTLPRHNCKMKRNMKQYEKHGKNF